MIISGLLLAFFVSFLAHIYSLVTYVTKKSDSSLKTFIKTTISNIMLAGACIIVIMLKPDMARQVDLKFITWVMSGIIMVTTLLIQIGIFKRIYQRSKDPSHYHINFFGKKVLHSTVINRFELAMFLGSMPFFMTVGAYFIARMVNFFLHNHL